MGWRSRAPFLPSLGMGATASLISPLLTSTIKSGIIQFINVQSNLIPATFLNSTYDFSSCPLHLLHFHHTWKNAFLLDKLYLCDAVNAANHNFICISFYWPAQLTESISKILFSPSPCFALSSLSKPGSHGYRH